MQFLSYVSDGRGSLNMSIKVVDAAGTIVNSGRFPSIEILLILLTNTLIVRPH